jgi:hypothetical protein
MTRFLASVNSQTGAEGSKQDHLARDIPSSQFGY